jgi:DnaA family protein
MAIDPASPQASRRADVSQMILDFGPPPVADLENFVPGRNGECLAALRALPVQLRDGVDPPYRFVYVWGPLGCGKTHLATALTAHELPQLTVVDDCDRLTAAAQQQLFHRFDAIAQLPGQALVTFGNAPPARLALMPELASRLAWGSSSRWSRSATRISLLRWNMRRWSGAWCWDPTCPPTC